LNYDVIKVENIKDILFFQDGYFVKELQTDDFLIRAFNLKNELIKEIRLSRHPQVKYFAVTISTIVTIVDDSNELWFIDLPTYSLMFKHSIQHSNTSSSQNYLRLVTIQSNFILIFNQRVFHILDVHQKKSIICPSVEINRETNICVSVIRKKLIIECNDKTLVFKTKLLQRSLPNFPHHASYNDIHYVDQIK
jgi:hypothetical protein